MTAIMSLYRIAMAHKLDIKLQTNHSCHGGLDVVIWKRADPDGEKWSMTCKEGFSDEQLSRTIARGIEEMK